MQFMGRYLTQIYNKDGGYLWRIQAQMTRKKKLGSGSLKEKVKLISLSDHLFPIKIRIEKPL